MVDYNKNWEKSSKNVASNFGTGFLILCRDTYLDCFSGQNKFPFLSFQVGCCLHSLFTDDQENYPSSPGAPRMYTKLLLLVMSASKFAFRLSRLAGREELVQASWNWEPGSKPRAYIFPATTLKLKFPRFGYWENWAVLMHEQGHSGQN